MAAAFPENSGPTYASFQSGAATRENVVYAGAKGFISTATRGWAKEVVGDGIRVFIEFPENVGQGDMPPLFVIGPGGQGELVNYRISGHHLIVDRLFAVAELRLGDKHSMQRVRIVRAGARMRR